MTNERQKKLIYMTGLSLDKQTLNEIFRNVASDERYERFRHDVLSWIQEEVKNQEGLSLNIDESDEKPFSQTLDDSVISLTKNDTSNNPNYYKTLFLVLLVLSASSIDASGNNSANSLSQISQSQNGIEAGTVTQENPLPDKALDSIISDNYYRFMLYLTNQSDNRGLIPLTSQIESSDQNIDFGWIFSDIPHYKNKFIKGVNLEIKLEKFKEVNLVPELKKSFIKHYALLVINRLGNSETLKNIITDNDSEIESKISEYANTHENLEELKNLNLFGILLLSQVFHSLCSCINPEDEKINIHIKDSEDYFTKEIVLLAGAKGKTNTTCVESDAHICISSAGNKFNDNFINENEGIINLHVPVNMVLSLPVKADGENFEAQDPSTSCIPHNHIPDHDLNILSVGGVEHNRPMLNLINRARWFSEDNCIGLSDNFFDSIKHLEQIKNNVPNPIELLNVNSFVGGTSILNVRAKDRQESKTKGERSAQVIDLKLNLDGTKNAYIRALIGANAPSSSIAILHECMNLNLETKEDESLFKNFTENKTYTYCWADGVEIMLNEETGNMDPYSYLINLDQLIKENEERKRLGKNFKDVAARFKDILKPNHV